MLVPDTVYHRHGLLHTHLLLALFVAAVADTLFDLHPCIKVQLLDMDGALSLEYDDLTPRLTSLLFPDAFRDRDLAALPDLGCLRHV